jgi:hypothetical protein
VPLILLATLARGLGVVVFESEAEHERVIAMGRLVCGTEST